MESLEDFNAVVFLVIGIFLAIIVNTKSKDIFVYNIFEGKL